MSGMDIYRARTLSAPNCTMEIGDPVFARTHRLAPEFRGRVVGRLIGRPIYDVEAADGELFAGLTLVRLDEEALAAQRAALALDGAA